MTKIPYEYKIVNVNEHSMEVLYVSEEYGSTLVGVRLPFEGEKLEDIIESFSPAFHWHQSTIPKQKIKIGISGKGETLVTEETPDEETILKLWRDGVYVSKLQATETLKIWGLYDQAKEFAELIGNPLNLLFTDADVWRRKSETVISLFENLTTHNGAEFDDEKIDEFFRNAINFEL